MSLSPRDIDFLEELSSRSQSLRTFMPQIRTGKLQNEEKQLVREALSDELVRVGLRADEEPNALGLKIEDLIDKVGRLPER